MFGGGEEDGRRFQAGDELLLREVEVVETVEIDCGCWILDFGLTEAVLGKPLPVGLVGAGEFTGKLREAGFLNVGEGGEERGGEAGGILNGGVVGVTLEGQLPAEEFEGERRRCARGAHEVFEGPEIDVNVGGELAAEPDTQEVRGDDDGDRGERGPVFEGGGEGNFECGLEGADVDLTWRCGRKLVSARHG